MKLKSFLLKVYSSSLLDKGKSKKEVYGLLKQTNNKTIEEIKKILKKDGVHMSPSFSPKS